MVPCPVTLADDLELCDEGNEAMDGFVVKPIDEMQAINDATTRLAGAGVGADTKRRLEPGPEGVRILVIGSTPGRPYERPEGLQLPS